MFILFFVVSCWTCLEIGSNFLPGFLPAVVNLSCVCEKPTIFAGAFVNYGLFSAPLAPMFDVTEVPYQLDPVDSLLLRTIERFCYCRNWGSNFLHCSIPNYSSASSLFIKQLVKVSLFIIPIHQLFNSKIIYQLSRMSNYLFMS